ncbi:MAG: DUF1295 domain-containing protein [Candidatus Eisenbacteria bacterium]|nr:DUF1295 domain-containing protein [Candidatus Eisenbacteria bacterium]
MIWIGAASLFALMSVLWFVSYRKTNAGWVDIGWTIGTGGLGVLYAFLGDGDLLPRVAVGVLSGLWGLRLTVHLLPRLIGATEEEPRYARLRARWSTNTEPKMFLMFQAQTLLALILAITFHAAATSPNPGSALTVWVGVLLWIVGFVGESAADRQLARFKSDPKNRGKVCDVGLWRYSRHPNYFFEWVLWIGYGFVGTGGSDTWLAWIGPVLIGVLLVFVTGIPPSERQALRSRGDAYRAYMERTSPFIPLPPSASRRGTQVTT